MLLVLSHEASLDADLVTLKAAKTKGQRGVT